ncbi:MAG TPA: DUF4336 domain-containing protein [Rhizomicrobium sp.]|jgi:hypothetical protein|nr:DUF4336 domain-containing protein [Rhizomicrobium sp.]
MTSQLVPLGENIWIVDGPVVSFFGFRYPTRMAVIRLANGDLFIWSPIALTPELKAQIEALGRVRHLVSPNKLHHLSLPAWHAGCPEARLYASPGLVKKRRGIAFDGTLGNAPEPAWAGEIDQTAMSGSFVMTEVVFFHRLSRTALFADLIENFRPDWFTGWRGVVARLDGIVMPNAGAPRDWRFTFWNREAAQAALRQIRAWDAKQVVIAHGEIVHEHGAAFIRNSFRWLE